MGKSNRGDFFGVEVGTFQKVCALGDANVAAGYLILAAGTDAGNRVTSWSREAINKRTSLNWRKADAVVSTLLEKGFARWVRQGARPRLELIYRDGRRPLTPKVQRAVEKALEGGAPLTPSEQSSVSQAAGYGYLDKDGDGWKALPGHKLAWLPLELVNWNGQSRPPVEQVRKGQDAQAFRLLVDLYAEQNLADYGGVFGCLVKRPSEAGDREVLGHVGAYRLLRFTNLTPTAWCSGPLAVHWREEEGGTVPLWDRFRVLQDAGVVEWVYHLSEDDSQFPSLVHPVAVVRSGKVDWSAPETMIGMFAQRAALAMHGGYDESDVKSCEDRMAWELVLPAERVMAKAQLIGIPRTRYRAKTRNAARWLKGTMDELPAFIEGYRALIAEHGPSLLAQADKRFADFNDGSTRLQRSVQRDLNDSDRSSIHDLAA